MNNSDQTPPKRRRSVLKLILFILLLLTVVAIVGGILVLRKNLDYVRELALNAIRQRTDVDINFVELQNEGLRTLTLKGLQIRAPLPEGGKVLLDADTVDVHLSLWGIVQRQVNVGNLIIEQAYLRLEGIGAPKPISNESGTSPNKTPLSWLQGLPRINVRGEKCAADIHFRNKETPLLLRDLTFSLLSHPGAALILGEVQGKISYGSSPLNILANGTFSQPMGFDVHIETSEFSPALLESFIRLPRGITGTASLILNAWGNPGKRIAATVDLNVKDFSYSALPISEAVSGTVSSFLHWQADKNRLDVLKCDVLSPLAEAQTSCCIDFNDDIPTLVLHTNITKIALDNILDQALPESIAKLGTLKTSFPQSLEINLSATGNLTAPKISSQIIIPSVQLSFQPHDKQLPEGNFEFSQGSFTWDNFSTLPLGAINISNGSVKSKTFGIEANTIMGTATVTPSGISLQPITAILSGKPFSGSLAYVHPEKKISFMLNGKLTELEKTPLHDVVKKLWLGGEVGFQVQGDYTIGGKLQATASAEVTRGMVAFEWWLRKPVGVGATIQLLEVTFVPQKSLEIKGQACIEDTHIRARLLYNPYKGIWKNMSIRIDIPQLEINSAGKCIQIPYKAVGGQCRDGFYESIAMKENPDYSTATVGGFFNDISFYPENGASPLICRNAQVNVVLINTDDERRSAELSVHAEEAHVPPFSEQWLLPIGPTDPTYAEKYPDKPRPWLYKLSADSIQLPPWEGRNFRGEVYSTDNETGFHFFGADVGEGNLEGTYKHEKEDNLMQLKATWNSIPARYIIRYLELPELLEGTISGEVDHVVDQDDPRTTMRSVGKFSIVKGHFLGDALRDTFRHAFSDSLAALHPAALQFDSISSDVRIEGDHIYTDNLIIKSAGMRIKGNGKWIMDGDLDYRIDVAITPDLAEQLPLLRDNFNIQGFRMTKRDIELGFHLKGPTFKPTGQLTGLPPISITLVSGAAEMTGEAMRLLDTPRQLFLSIFRIGGGILGATRTQQ